MNVTLENIQVFLSSEYPVIYCEDGFTVGVNAGWVYNSKPKRDKARFYFEVEVGYPSEPYRPLRLYADDKKKYPNTTFANVPLDLVVAMLNSHCGIDGVTTEKQPRKLNEKV